MAVARSYVDKAFTGGIIKFPETSKEHKVVDDFIKNVNIFKNDCDNKTKSSKQLLKQYNAIIATTKRAEKAIISGKLNHTINQHICEQFTLAKKDLQKTFSSIK